jgi:hypothetical protein
VARKPETRGRGYIAEHRAGQRDIGVESQEARGSKVDNGVKALTESRAGDMGKR